MTMVLSVWRAIVQWGPDCPMAAILGVHCPGCGLTRAIALCIEGDVAGAFNMHPLAPVILGQAGLLLVMRLVRGRSDGYRRVERYCLRLDLIALIVVWVVRP